VRLHHMGYVVRDIEPAMRGFVHSLQATWDSRIFDDPHQKVRVAFLTTRPEDAQIELVQPAGEDSPVYRFLQEKGGGLHHACYEVRNLEAQIEEMRSRGALLAKRPRPAVAFEGRRIAWLLTAEKFLIELLESTAEGASQ
jgi:methylmalonyl-CoA/ethylmalonyl-CoA epimerase